MRLLRCVCFAFLLLCAPAWGYQVISGSQVTVPAGQKIDDDLLITGKSVEVAGEVTGDLYVFGNTVNITGPVGGSIYVGAQTVMWDGAASGSANLAGQNVNASGSAKRNFAFAGQNVTIADKASAGREMLAAGASVAAGGTAAKGTRLAGSSVVFSGKTEGPLTLAAETARVTGGAVVGGDLTSYGQRKPTIEPGAQVRGVIRHVPPKAEAGARRARHKHPIRGFLFRFGLWGVLGLFVLLIAPRMLSQSADSIGARPGACLGFGAIALICAPVAFVIVSVTLVGISVGLLVMGAYLIALLLSGLFVSLFVGRKILGPKRATWAALLLGVAVVALACMLPHVGWLISVVVVVFGLGAEMVWLGAALGRQRATPPPPPPSAPAPAEGTAAS